MRNGQLDNVLRHIRGLATAQQTRKLPDRDLLRQFVEDHDEAAFAAIVQRQGPLVLGVCRRLLRNEHHAEDACQATFLILARKASTIRKRESLGSWLHGVACRVARKLQADIKRRAAKDLTAADVAGPDTTGEITWREGLVVLDEELSRLPATYRSALILCYLQGRRQDEAAKELGCSVGALCGRLVRARERLRIRLLRRGVGVPAGLLATTLVSTHAEAALPPVLAIGMTKAVSSLIAGQALACVVPANVATLTEGVLTAMSISRVKMGLGVIVTMSLVTAGVGAFAGAAWSPTIKPAANESGNRAATLGVRQHLLALACDDKRESAAPGETTSKGGKKGDLAVNGRVVDPEGKPVAGARLHQGSAQKGVSDAQGQFQFSVKPSDFPMQIVAAADGFGLGSAQVAKPQAAGGLTLRLVKDLPIAGHIIDPEGRPVAGATIRLFYLWATPEEDLTGWLNTVKKRKANSLYDGDYFKNHIGVQGLPQTLTTDQAGRFRLAGVGRERMLIVTVGAPKFQYDMIGIMTRPAAAFQVTDEWKLTQNVYGARFDHVLAPSRAITGTVRDKDTGKPIAGVRIIPEGAQEYRSPEASSDQEGKYRIDSLPGYYAQQRDPRIPAPGVIALSRKNEPYLRVDRTIQLEGPRDEPLVIDFHMRKGLWVTVKVVNKATGKPVVGANVEYYPLRSNPNTAGLTAMSFSWMPHLDPHRTGPDGIARVPVLPGPGLLGAGTGSDAFFHMEPLPYAEAANVFSGIFQGGDMHNALQGIVKIDLKEAKPATYEIGLESSRRLSCVIVGPDGKPLTGCRVFGAENGWPP
jgi:RNA polymerase sigma factor (sigma-70 family)